MIYSAIDNLIAYAVVHLEADKRDEFYFRGQLMEVLHLTEFEESENKVDDKAISLMTCPDTLLAPITQYAIENSIINENEEEKFETRIMGILSKKPSEIQDKFYKIEKEDSDKAMQYLYEYCELNNYIKTSKIAKNKQWVADNTDNKIEVTINLSRPEKNNKQTAQELNKKQTNFPKCAICPEHEGLANNSRQNLRYIPLKLSGGSFFWQYSPYLYFNMHGICVNMLHTPMVVNPQTFENLLDFVDRFPTLFLGSNAPLPRVGGSILTHDHYQGGKYSFPMQLSGNRFGFESTKYPDVKVSIVEWYNSVIRLQSKNRESLSKLANELNEAWFNYDNIDLSIIAKTTEQHSCVSPIMRKQKDIYICDMILRNNRTNDEFPEGIFHAHKEYHNIKSESIGLIEAMGMFILPPRLDRQLKIVEAILSGSIDFDFKKLDEDMQIHKDWTAMLVEKYGTKNKKDEASKIIKEEVNLVCESILKNSAVFKEDGESQNEFIDFVLQNI